MQLSEYKLDGWRYKSIVQSIEVDDVIVLLLKINLDELGFKGRIKNLLAVDRNETILWIAEIPFKYSSDYIFTDIKFQDEKLMAWRGDLYCEIDITNGAVLFSQETR